MIVLGSYAVVEPHAMVVKLHAAPVAAATVFGFMHDMAFTPLTEQFVFFLWKHLLRKLAKPLVLD